MTDHLRRQLAPTAALAAAAAVTDSLRIGPYVFANDFRHPLIVAREAATLDRLSGGRLDLGLGAGWKRSDYRQLGMPYDPPGVRIDRMIESLGIIRRLLSGEEVTHQGRFYRLDGRASSRRRSSSRTRGSCSAVVVHACCDSRRTRRRSSASCRSSRSSGRPMMRHATESALAERVSQVRKAAGARFERARAEHLRRRRWRGRRADSRSRRPSRALLKSAGPAVAGGSPYLLYGTLDQLREGMLRRRDRTGVSSYGIPARVMEAFAPLVASLAGR